MSTMKLVARNEIHLDNPDKAKRDKIARVVVNPGEGFVATTVFGATLVNSEAARHPREEEELRMSPHFRSGLVAGDDTGSTEEDGQGKRLDQMSKAELLAEAEARGIELPADADTKAKIVAAIEAAADAGGLV